MADKRCTKCGSVKPLSEFYKCSGNHDGLKGMCKICVKQQHAQYYIEHHEEYKVHMRSYYREHIDEYKVHDQEYYQQHVEERRAHIREYGTSDVGRAVDKAAKHNRRIQGGSQLTGAVIRDVVEASNGVCPYCGKSFKEGHMDHIVPLSRGGTNDRDNLAYVCASCNLHKHTMTVEEFATGGLTHG